MNLRQGTLLKHGEYRIECELGHGGFGVTYLAVQVGLNRRVAIKEFFMSEYCNRDAETSHVSVPSEGSKELVAKFRSKFIKEAQNIASLKHPHIISIYDVFEDNGTAYYVMEYLDHGSLADVVKRQGRLPEADAVRYTRQIADALRYIHARKMNHLDVKLGNILIDEEDHAVLIDFGLSKRYDDEGNQTSTTPVGISHGYAPLEQYKKGGVGTFSPATDIYSLGATLYKLITGSTPPDANDVGEEGLPPFPANVSAATAKAIEQAMQFRRKDRPQSIEEFLGLLDATGSSAVTEEKEEEEQTKLIVEDNENVNDKKNAHPHRVGTSLFSFKKFLILLLACVVAGVLYFYFRPLFVCVAIVIAFFGVRKCKTKGFLPHVGKIKGHEFVDLGSDKIHPTMKNINAILYRLKNIHRHFWDFRGRTTRKAFLILMLFVIPICLLMLCAVDNPLLEVKYWMEDLGFGYGLICVCWNTFPILSILCLTFCLEIRRLNDCGRSRWWALVFNIPLLLLWLPQADFWAFMFMKVGRPSAYILFFVLALLSLYIAVRFFLAKSKS